jgi:hypothetical protein
MCGLVFIVFFAYYLKNNDKQKVSKDFENKLN